MKQQQLCLLGATGSIGSSTLDVVSRYPERFAVYALSAQTQVEKLAQLCLQFLPKVAVIGDAKAADRLAHLLQQQAATANIQILHGADALCQVASAPETDVVMAAIVGAAGLPSSLAAAKAGKRVLLANKEALVMSGALFMQAVAQNGATLLPIDSEHNAIFQCLPAHYNRRPAEHGVAKVLLTASGGPFLHRDLASLDSVTPEQAVAHPKWVMGRKISVDSATMMNKGLEVIEAHWLFGAPADQIDVVIHPQSIIHSMVSYCDGSVLAQMGNPDMRIPIAYGLAYPERLETGVAALDLTQIAQLNFLQPDLQRFPCLDLAYQALRGAASDAVVLNAANEVAVAAFLEQRIGFRQIERVISGSLNKLQAMAVDSIEAVLECDAMARRCAQGMLV